MTKVEEINARDAAATAAYREEYAKCIRRGLPKHIATKEAERAEGRVYLSWEIA